MGLFVFMIVLAILAPFIYIYYRFLRTLRDLLRAVSEQNRGMSPGLVWLNWIPFFSLAWMFVTIVKIRESASKEFAYRGVRANGGEGFGLGITFAVANVLSEISVPPSALQDESVILAVAILSGLIGLAGLVCWILYWVKAANLRDWLVNTMGARKPSPTQITYQPASWQLPPESPLGSAPAAAQTGPWQGGQQSTAGQTSTGAWLSGQAQAGQSATPEAVPASGPGNCSYCGVQLRPNAGYCSLCGRPVPE